MSKSKLKEEITKNLKKLDELVEKVRNTGIDIEEENNWDCDYYSELQTNLENALALLKDKVLLGKLNEFGDPIISEKGILTLLTEWEGDE